jgi:hypothetical protein
VASINRHNIGTIIGYLFKTINLSVMKTKLDIRKILSSGKSSGSKKLGSIDKALLGLGAKTNYQKV